MFLLTPLTFTSSNIKLYILLLLFISLGEIILNPFIPPNNKSPLLLFK